MPLKPAGATNTTYWVPGTTGAEALPGEQLSAAPEVPMMTGAQVPIPSTMKRTALNSDSRVAFRVVPVAVTRYQSVSRLPGSLGSRVEPIPNQVWPSAAAVNTFGLELHPPLTVSGNACAQGSFSS